MSIKCLESFLKEAREILKRKERCGTEGDPDHGFRIYRQVQILGVIFNKENQALSQPTLMVAVVMATASSLYTCGKLHKYVPMPAFLIFPVALGNCFLIMFIAKVASGVLTESVKCLEVARKNSGRGQGGSGRRSLNRRLVKAIRKVMVKFGSNNFHDQQTPFNLMNQALSASVSAMLLR